MVGLLLLSRQCQAFVPLLPARCDRGLSDLRNEASTRRITIYALGSEGTDRAGEEEENLVWQDPPSTNGSVWDNFIEIFIGDEEEDDSTNSSAQRYMMKVGTHSVLTRMMSRNFVLTRRLSVRRRSRITFCGMSLGYQTTRC